MSTGLALVACSMSCMFLTRYVSGRIGFKEHIQKYAKEGFTSRNYYPKNASSQTGITPKRDDRLFITGDITDPEGMISFYDADNSLQTYNLPNNTMFEFNNPADGIEEHTKVYYLLQEEDPRAELAKVEYITDNREFMGDYIIRNHYPGYSANSLGLSFVYGYITFGIMYDY